MKTPTDKEKQLLAKAIRLYYDACGQSGTKSKEPEISKCDINPAFVVLKDSKGEIASITRRKRHLYFAVKGITYAQEI